MSASPKRGHPGLGGHLGGAPLPPPTAVTSSVGNGNDNSYGIQTIGQLRAPVAANAATNGGTCLNLAPLLPGFEPYLSHNLTFCSLNLDNKVMS